MFPKDTTKPEKPNKGKTPKPKAGKTKDNQDDEQEEGEEENEDGQEDPEEEEEAVQVEMEVDEDGGKTPEWLNSEGEETEAPEDEEGHMVQKLIAESDSSKKNGKPKGTPKTKAKAKAKAKAHAKQEKKPKAKGAGKQKEKQSKDDKKKKKRDDGGDEEEDAEEFDVFDEEMEEEEPPAKKPKKAKIEKGDKKKSQAAAAKEKSGKKIYLVNVFSFFVLGVIIISGMLPFNQSSIISITTNWLTPESLFPSWRFLILCHQNLCRMAPRHWQGCRRRPKEVAQATKWALSGGRGWLPRNEGMVLTWNNSIISSQTVFETTTDCEKKSQSEMMWCPRVTQIGRPISDVLDDGTQLHQIHQPVTSY